MSKYDTPEPDRPALYVDKEYQGISGYYPGATIRQPARRRPNSDRQTWGLTADDLALNKEINGTRIVVEHAIGMIKRYRITTRPFWCTPKELNDELNIISGLVNLNLDWDRIKKISPWYRSWSRKGQHADSRRGPGPPSNRQNPSTQWCCQAAHDHPYLALAGHADSRQKRACAKYQAKHPSIKTRAVAI